MSDAWKSYRGAPKDGTVLFRLDDLVNETVVCLEIDGFPILLIQQGEDLRAYVNACPHQFLPLNHKGNKLLSENGRLIRCTNHGAGFLVATGEGAEGLGIGECLDAIPIRVDGEVVVIFG